MAVSSLGQYALSFTFMKAHKNQKQLRVVAVPSSVSFPALDSGALLVTCTPNPSLDRAQLSSIFVNFINIWNLCRSFLSSPSVHLHTPTEDGRSPPIVFVHGTDCDQK